jgi:uncharacterized protein YdhG (YjbR/CyaY superfamily)
MEKSKNLPKSIDDYISQFPPRIQKILKSLRKLIKEAAPEAEERISYRMPAFMQKGPLVYFAAFKNHIGFYPTSSGISAFKNELSEYAGGKGSVQFPMEKPLPVDLIRRIVKFRASENNAKKKSGKKK